MGKSRGEPSEEAAGGGTQERWCWPGPGISGGGETGLDSGCILKVKLKDLQLS